MLDVLNRDGIGVRGRCLTITYFLFGSVIIVDTKSIR